MIFRVTSETVPTVLYGNAYTPSLLNLVVNLVQGCLRQGSGNSLMVQWLGLRTSTAGGTGLIPGSWQIDGETVERMADFILGGSNITADGDCSHEIKRRLLLERKVMTNLDSILKQRHYFANKGLSSQGYGFSCGHVWMLDLDCEEG